MMDTPFFSSLRDRIHRAWKELPPIPTESIVEPGTMPLDKKEVQEYFAGKLTADVDPGDACINGLQPYWEAFTNAAKHYYAGAYLQYLLHAYTYTPPEDADMAVIHFRSFLLSEDATKIGFTPEQMKTIAEVLNFVANQVDITTLSEDQIDKLLRAVDYWKG